LRRSQTSTRRPAVPTINLSPHKDIVYTYTADYNAFIICVIEGNMLTYPEKLKQRWKERIENGTKQARVTMDQ